MPARIEWTEAALARLIELTDPLGRRDPSAARRLVARLMDRVEDLARFPRMGPPWTPAEDDAVLWMSADETRVERGLRADKCDFWDVVLAP